MGPYSGVNKAVYERICLKPFYQQGHKMSTSYDEDIFVRDWVRFTLSQRFKENYHKFYGTLKTAVLVGLANTMLALVPQPYFYFLLFFYFFTLATLVFLTTKEGVWDKRKGNAEYFRISSNLSIFTIFYYGLQALFIVSSLLYIYGQM